MDEDTRQELWKKQMRESQEEHLRRLETDPEYRAEFEAKAEKKRKALNELIRLQDELGLDD